MNRTGLLVAAGRDCSPLRRPGADSSSTDGPTRLRAAADRGGRQHPARAPGPTSARACRPGSPPSMPRTSMPTSPGSSRTRCGRWPVSPPTTIWGAPTSSTSRRRGFYSSPVVGLPQGVAVFLDGVRMNEPEASQINFDLLPMDHIQRIEMLSGNGSLLGPQRARRRGQPGDRARAPARPMRTSSCRAAASARRGARRNVSGLTEGGLDWYAGGNYNREDGWRQVTGAEEYSGFVNVGKLGETSGIRFQGFYARLLRADRGLAAGDRSSGPAPTPT